MNSNSNPLIRPGVPESGIVSGINKLPEIATPNGIDLEDLPIGAVVEIETGHTTYRMENKGEGGAILSGHPKYCPEPTLVQMQGSVGSDGTLKWRYLGTGCRMVFTPPEHAVIRTSSIKSMRRVPPGPKSSN